MFEDYNDFLILAIPLGIMIIPLIVGFIYKYRSKPAFPKNYHKQFDDVELSPPKGLSPFLASYIIDSRISHFDITVLLYRLLKKNIIHVVPMGGKFNRDYVFMFQQDKNNLSIETTQFEKILLEALWSSDNMNKQEVLDEYPHLSINYPICRFSKLKRPSQKLIKEARKELKELGYLKEKKISRLKVAGLLLLIPILFFVNSKFASDLEVSGKLSAAILMYIVFIYSHLPLTKEGNRIKRELAGFRHYLNRVEGERILKIRQSPNLYEDEYHLRYFEYILAFNVLGQYASANDWRKMEHAWYDKPVKKSFNDLGSIGELIDHIKNGNKTY